MGQNWRQINRASHQPTLIAVRWGYDEIKDWVAAGCPNANEWKKMGKRLET
jgi:hypothetical protein